MVFVSHLYAHQTGLSYIELIEDQNGKVSVTYKKPLADTQADDIFINYPVICNSIYGKKRSIEDGYVVEKFDLLCGQEGLKDTRLWVDGLVSSDKGVLIRYVNDEIIQKALLRSSTPFIHFNYKPSKFKLFIEYIELGVIHILAGYDHLLFILGLFLLSKNLKVLLLAITGFTLSHSITLAFGILGIVNVDIAFIEAMIALSIVFLARELAYKNKDSFTKKYLGVVAFIFGLLHGFGFSSVLSSIGLPQDEIPLSLFAFNVGIELGQIIFITLLGIIMLYIKRYVNTLSDTLYKVSAYFIGAFSMFWLIERVVAF
jgi:hydrogenase/urease accessory protein HupE